MIPLRACLGVMVFYMRVLIIADEPVDHSGQFVTSQLAAAWQSAAPHTQVGGVPFAADTAAVRAVWQHHAATRGGFTQTALVIAYPDLPRWQTLLADELVTAVRSGCSRIVVALPRYAYPDSGARLLSKLIDRIGAMVLSATEILADPELYDSSVDAVARFLAKTDVIVTYTENVPLTGMHGMSGTAALLGDLEGSEAQQRERINSSLLFGLGKLGRPLHSHEPSMLVGSASTVENYKDLSRHDAAGAAGGAGFALLAAGARALPLSRVLSAQFDLPQHIAASDLIVVNQGTLDGRTHANSTLGIATELAAQHALPVVAITQEQIMSTRELAAAGISGSYVCNDTQLAETAARLATSWTPNR